MRRLATRLRNRRRDWRELALADAEPALAELADEDRAIVERAVPYSMTSVTRLLAVVDAVRYCERRGIAGALAECGVWRGGSVLAMLLTLQESGTTDRDVYVYDTFEGMTEPTDADVSVSGESALDAWQAARTRRVRPWNEVFGEEAFGESSVRELLESTGYPPDRLHFVRGPVEQTIPGTAPNTLALLNLDTDWYESTRHELEHLYPRLADGGVLLIDDYGHWQGARRAVDEYFAAHGAPLLLHRIDYSARAAVKH
jgi:O-methyltransferase